MRILELGKFYPPHRGGIETLLESWSEGFAARGATVDCVVAAEGPASIHETINGVRVHRLASFGMALSTSLCPLYLNVSRRYQPDLIHAHFPNPLADLASLLAPRKLPLVLSYHSDIVRQAGLMKLYGGLLQRLLARADAIVVATPSHIDCSPWLPAFRAKCHVIPFGIRLEKFSMHAAMSGEIARARAGAKGLPILLNIGRLVGYKGQQYLMEAAAKLEAVVWIAGTGPLDAELKQRAVDLKMADRVHFWGGVSDHQLVTLLHACDVFVLPSITPNEAFAIVQVEAMACAKPVVNCALASGVPFVSRHEETGLTVPPADAPALRAALQTLISQPRLREEFGRAGRARAAAEFSEPVMLDRYWTLFENLAGRRAA